MNNYHFNGPFAEYIKNYVELKQAIGYKYDSEATHLLRFSNFIDTHYPNATELSK
ncbi:hypothetical protein [Cellulosilyticum sp. I15G10I2]|uniref:hypothetical protein n=1 Tax=Cellulosilyticum sp. I15G10I2 TaxID=1892843 RepID=UPI001FA6E20A|nr:hypothetical protein [Cellulosilyticum sp. I15G10I2]